MQKILSPFIVLVLFCVFSASGARAVSLSVVDRSDRLVTEGQIDAAAGSSVGAVTLEFLKQAQTRGAIHSFQAYDSGVISIDEVGNDVEVVSDTELRAWGWCFTLNGVVSETMPDATFTQSNDDHIDWFYGYAHYLDGQWLGQCLKPETIR